MLQQDEPDDYVVATGETHSIRELLDVAFGRVGIEDWAPYVTQDPRFFRPAEVDVLIGDAGKAKDRLAWKPSVKFEQLVEMMVDADLAAEKHMAGEPYPGERSPVGRAPHGFARSGRPPR